MKFAVSLILILTSFSLSADELENNMVSLIESTIYIQDVNRIYQEENDLFDRYFSETLELYLLGELEDGEVRALMGFELVYRDVHLQNLEDAPDLRRQANRYLLGFCGIALCHNEEAKTFFRIAEQPLLDENGSVRMEFESKYLALLLLELLDEYRNGVLSRYTTLDRYALFLDSPESVNLSFEIRFLAMSIYDWLKAAERESSYEK